MGNSRSIINESTLSSCYFRSSVEPPYRKALIRITDLCNARCVHCFISADNRGEKITLEKFQNIVLPRLKQCRVSHVTLTGGEPFLHPNIIEIVTSLTDANIKTGICTNAIEITNDQIYALSLKSNVHINVSLHGFSPESHDKFLGIKGAFAKCINNIKQLSNYGLIQGFLVTPNNFANIQEYEKLCEFAIKNNAKYVLMNPISPMGRGVTGVAKYALSEETLKCIKRSTLKYSNRIQIVYIRFPNDEMPLGSCEAGNIIYMFVNGDVAVCAYLVFAADTSISKYDRKEFIVGNIIQDVNFSQELDSYEFKRRYPLGNNDQCKQCDQNIYCGKGCPAAVICMGKEIGETDSEVCPNQKKDIKDEDLKDLLVTID
jgi:radical SAM protein with 4Fe4S-binding SPASM domain